MVGLLRIIKLLPMPLNFWRRNNFFLMLAHPVYTGLGNETGKTQKCLKQGQELSRI